MLQYIFSGLTIGSIYALIALGYTIIYNTTGIINFAQGEFVMLGGMLMIACVHTFHLPLLVSVSVSALMVVLIGIAIERIAIRPAKHASLVTLIIITIGISIILKAIAAFVSKDSFTYPQFPGPEHIRVMNASISGQSLWIIGTACVMMILLSLFFRLTLRGKAMRACADSREASWLVGIDVDQMSQAAFGMSAMIGAIAGIMVTPATQMSWFRGTELGLKGFCAMILGGLGSSPGAVVGGLALGLLETFGSYLFSGYKDAIAFSMFLIVIYIRPSGIMGKK